MMNLSKPKKHPAITTILGSPGMGKTLLASGFKKPVFLRTEDGMQSIPSEKMPDATPVFDNPKAAKNVYGFLKQLGTEEHDYQTLVVDSITALDSLFEQHILKSDPSDPSGLNQACGGYGAGVDKLRGMHDLFMKYCIRLSRKIGMYVVFLGHTKTIQMQPPTGEDYTKISLAMNKKVSSVYINNSDVIAFMDTQRVVSDSGKANAVMDGARYLYTGHSEAFVSKARLDIPGELLVKEGQNPLVEYLENAVNSN